MQKKMLLITALFAAVAAGPAWADDDRPIGYKNITTPAGTFKLPIFSVDPIDRNQFTEEPDGEDMVERSSTGQSIRNIMSPVRNQGGRGTCTLFAAIGVIEAFRNKDYSEQCLARFSSSEDGGFTDRRLDYVQSQGLYTESQCPYDSGNRNNIPNLDNVTPDKFDHDFEVVSSKRKNPIQYIKDRIHSFSPVAIAVYVVGNWNNGFIYMPTDSEIKACSSSCGGHAVVATGYNDMLGLIEFKNSWGTGWGENGYGYMSYDYFLRFRKSSMVSY